MRFGRKLLDFKKSIGFSGWSRMRKNDKDQMGEEEGTEGDERASEPTTDHSFLRDPLLCGLFCGCMLAHAG